MAHKIDQNKVERIETPYGNGYAYGGRIYSDKQWKDILDFNAGGSIVPGGYSDKTGTYDGFANKMIAGPEGEIQTENQYRNAINYGDAWNSDKPWGTKTPEQAQYFKDMNASATKNKVIDSNGNIINPKGFKRGGRALAAQEEAAWNKEMGIDDASVRADEAAINASKDALEQSYSDKNDAAEDDRIDRYSSASNESDARDARVEEGRYLAARNQVRRDANPVSEQVSRGTGVAKGAFDETGDAENAPVSLINNQTTNKKPVKKQKDYEYTGEDITEQVDLEDPNIRSFYWTSPYNKGFLNADDNPNATFAKEDTYDYRTNESVAKKRNKKSYGEFADKFMSPAKRDINIFSDSDSPVDKSIYFTGEDGAKQGEYPMWTQTSKDDPDADENGMLYMYRDADGNNYKVSKAGMKNIKKRNSIQTSQNSDYSNKLFKGPKY